VRKEDRNREVADASGKHRPRPQRTAPRAPGPLSLFPNAVGNQLVQRLFQSGAIQAKLRISQPGEPDELEADRVAAQVVSSGDSASPSSTPSPAAPSSPQLHRKCDRAIGETCPECQSGSAAGDETIHRKSAAPSSARAGAPGPARSGALTPAAAPARVLQGLGSGRSLDSPLRASMESRFGHDFSSVRVHDDAKAGESAGQINARAFTAGTDIVFARGEFAPGTLSGLRLLAHELAHVVQQRHGPKLLARAPAAQYETKGITLDPLNVTKVSKGSFWEERLGRSVELREDPRIFQGKDPEERDAVLAAVSKVLPPAGFKSVVTQLVSIPARASAPGTKPLLYKVTFTPRKGKLPLAEIEFVAEGAAAQIKPTGPAPAGFVAHMPSLRFSGFPGNDIRKYWKAHPEEEEEVLAWIDSLPRLSFDQVIRTAVSTRVPRKVVTREVSYHVKGAKDATGNILNLEVDFIGTAPVSAETPPADYHSKQVLDEHLEHAQTALDPKKKDKLGKVNGIAGLPPEERPSVQNAILQYFETGTRNSEVDAIIPIPDSTRRILYTLRFHPKSNDVDVQRIGEEGKDVHIAPPRLSLYRVAHFHDLANDIPKLKDWIHKRYPSVTVTGSTAKEICANVDAQISAKAGTPAWFFDNYGIKILSGADGATRLVTAHPKQMSPLQVRGTKNFSPEELMILESTLETASDSILAGFKGIQMVRQNVKLDVVGAGKRRRAVPDKQEGGLSLETGSERTIVIFDTAHINDASLFIGGLRASGSTDVEPYFAETFAHELGHTVSWGPSVKAAFDKMVKKEKIETFTWYAAKKKTGEFFAESFMLFQLDPDWLQANSPKIFHFFEVLTTTGNPPTP
jgi:Domain of unknown function (DUF4157)